MITLASIRQTVIDWIEDDSDTDLIDRTINTQIRFTTKKTFEGLHRSVDVTPDSDGIITAPPAMNFPTGIYPQTANGELASFIFYPRTARPQSDEPRTNRYLYGVYESTRTDDNTMVVSGTQESSTLTWVSGDAVATTMVGSELKIKGDNTRYLITSVVAGTSLEIFPTLRATSGTSLTALINPAGMKRYILRKPDGSAYTDTVTIDYQIDHPPLVADDDELLIPMERTVALLTVQQFLQQSKYDVDAERLTGAIFEARLTEYGAEPTNMQDSAPRDSMFSFRSKRNSTTRR